MGEAFITRSGGSAGGSSGSDSNFITEIFTASTLWKVPENLKDGTVSVRIFGGGSASIGNNGGGGGYMNNATVNISNESEIYISIGRGGIRNNKVSTNSYNELTTQYGGTSSFGTYLYALGGYGIDGGYGDGGIGYQFGGGGASDKTISSGNSGGNGGKWGGGGGSFVNDVNNYGTGFGGCLYENSQYIHKVTGYSGLAGNGGNNYYTNAKNGINTIGKGLDFEGSGLYGKSNKLRDTYGRNRYAGGGGGGYGGNGGNGVGYNNISSSGSEYYYDAGCGGGGGYGANGGNGCVFTIYNNGKPYSVPEGVGGGGGGYGGDGGTGYGEQYSISDSSFSMNICGGGGGGYGKYGKGGGLHNGVFYRDGGIAAGGCLGNGGDGICIIQYYIK